MAGEVLDWPASLETIDFPLIFLDSSSHRRGGPPFLVHFFSIESVKFPQGTFRHSDEENERRVVIEVSVASAILA